MNSELTFRYSYEADEVKLGDSFDEGKKSGRTMPEILEAVEAVSAARLETLRLLPFESLLLPYVLSAQTKRSRDLGLRDSRACF